VQKTLTKSLSGVAPRPFIKWVGGKRQLLPELLRHAPVKFSRYFEPFLGGGALFFRLMPAKAILADANERLIRAYRGVRNSVDEVVGLLKSYPHDARFFYTLRSSEIDSASDAEVAAWFIYLNKTGFNGLYRVNRKNGFNVTFGRYTAPAICDEPTLRGCSAALAKAELMVADFEQVVAGARQGDFVYFDPPYVPLSVTSSFASYTSRGFGPEDQMRLRDVARDLRNRGVHILLSNSSSPFVQDLYKEGFEKFRVAATRLVNSNALRRGAIAELVIK
jgi:DNA adenine methylase